MAVRFYQLSVTPLTKALPKLLEKMLAQSKDVQIILHTSDSALLETVDSSLWTYTPMGFLPHGFHTDDYAEAQPILLCSSTDYVSQDKGCVSLDPVGFFDNVPVPLVYMFDDKNRPPFENLAERYSEMDLPVSFMVQGADGGWQQP